MIFTVALLVLITCLVVLLLCECNIFVSIYLNIAVWISVIVISLISLNDFTNNKSSNLVINNIPETRIEIIDKDCSIYYHYSNITYATTKFVKCKNFLSEVLN